MQTLSNKHRWKRLLLVAALVIVGITLWFASKLTRDVRNEEHQKVEVWSEAIEQRAELVAVTEELFNKLENDERQKADLLASAYRLINNPPENMDFTFVTEFLWSNKTIPVLIYDDTKGKVFDINLHVDGVHRDSISEAQFDSIRDIMASRFEPIPLADVCQTIYYDESLRLRDLKDAMNEFIESFLSETVLNSASVPVIVTGGLGKKVYDSRGIEARVLESPELLEARLDAMGSKTNPILIKLPNGVARKIYFEDSYVLTQMKYYPLIQLVLIAVFLLAAYLVFSSSRRAEQNRVWVGMAKETAHQLGTPLSSLMAWVELLEAKDVDKEMLVEMKKDVTRLHTVTDRFSKIGSQPELKLEDLSDSLQKTVSYMRPRISKKVELTLSGTEQSILAKFNPSLLSWVLENLLRNAVDAMEGQGDIRIMVSQEKGAVQIDIEDSGKGITRSDARNVFSPGFTTKKRGWGLGLSLTKRIIEEYHNGTITLLKTELGVGTTFRITL